MCLKTGLLPCPVELNPDFLFIFFFLPPQLSGDKNQRRVAFEMEKKAGLSLLDMPFET